MKIKGYSNNTQKKTMEVTEMTINYNIIDDDLIQIYGEANGFAWRVEFKGQKVWRYSISFFQAGKQIKITTSEREGSLDNIESLKKNIVKKVTQKY